jgi:hypothetical protein
MTHGHGHRKRRAGARMDAYLRLVGRRGARDNQGSEGCLVDDFQTGSGQTVPSQKCRGSHNRLSWESVAACCNVRPLGTRHGKVQDLRPLCKTAVCPDPVWKPVAGLWSRALARRGFGSTGASRQTPARRGQAPPAESNASLRRPGKSAIRLEGARAGSRSGAVA